MNIKNLRALKNDKIKIDSVTHVNSQMSNAWRKNDVFGCHFMMGSDGDVLMSRGTSFPNPSCSDSKGAPCQLC